MRQQYLPDPLKDRVYYHYGDNKTEQAARRYWEEIKKILVVEDDPDINQLLCTIMQRRGLSVPAAFSGSEAMLWAERERFDLVLLDLMLPGLTGEEFIAQNPAPTGPCPSSSCPPRWQWTTG